MRIIFFTVFFLLFLTAKSQNTSIQGILKSVSGDAISYSSVSLKKAQDGAGIDLQVQVVDKSRYL